MKSYIHKSFSSLCRSKAILAVVGSFLLVSCGTQMGGYSETDGVYYDPNNDTLPEGVVIDDRGNAVGEYYNYNSEHLEDVRSRDWQENSKYWDDNASASDWGAYAGSETNYYHDNWGWGSPWGYYSPYYSGWRVGLSWGWGHPYSWSGWGWYDPYWGYGPYSYWGYPYSNWYYSGYGYYGYNPYYYGPSYRYQRSGANGRLYNSYQGGQGLYKQGTQGGFRSMSDSRVKSSSQPLWNTTPRTRNNSIRNVSPSSTPSQQVRPTPGYRPQSNPRQAPVRDNQPRYQAPRTSSNDSGGFRSGGFNNNSSSGGGFRSGGSTGGGMRSGGR